MWVQQGFSQDFRIGYPKIIWGELGVQFFFIPLHYTQKIWILGCPKSAIGCPKDTQTPLWLKAWGTRWLSTIDGLDTSYKVNGQQVREQEVSPSFMNNGSKKLKSILKYL